METYCISCKKNTYTNVLSNCAFCGKKNSTFLKNKELNNILNA